MPLRKSRENRHLRRKRAVVQSEHLSSSVGVLATEIGRKSGANFNMNLQKPAAVNDAGSIGCGSGKRNDSGEKSVVQLR